MASSTLTSAARGVAQVVSPVIIIIIIIMNMDLSICYTPPRLTENRESLREFFLVIIPCTLKLIEHPTTASFSHGHGQVGEGGSRYGMGNHKAIPLQVVSTQEVGLTFSNQNYRREEEECTNYKSFQLNDISIFISTLPLYLSNTGLGT